MDGCPAEPTGLALERGMPQSPEPPMGDLWGTMPLFMGPGKTRAEDTHLSELSKCYRRVVWPSLGP